MDIDAREGTADNRYHAASGLSGGSAALIDAAGERSAAAVDMPSPLLMIYAGESQLEDAHSLTPYLSTPQSSQETWQAYSQHIHMAVVSFQAAMQMVANTADANPAWDLRARLLLIQTLVEEKMIASDADKEAASRLVQKGLLVAGSHALLRPFKWALYSLQIRIWLETLPRMKAEKLALRELARIQQEIPKDQPEWIYHFLLLSHHLAPSESSFEAIHQFAMQRNDTLVALVIRVMRLHWALACRKAALALSDVEFLSEAFEKDRHAISIDPRFRWPPQLQMYFLMLKALYYASLSTQDGQTQTVKVTLAALHLMFSDGVEVTESEKSGVIELEIASAQNQSHVNRSSSIIYLTCMPRATIYALAFLVTMACSRDPIGHRPRLDLYADSGLEAINELLNQSKPEEPGSSASVGVASTSRQASIGVQARILLLQAEFALMRSKFTECEKLMRELLDITCGNHSDLWSELSSRVLLLQAMYWHALDRADEAIKFYHIAANCEKDNALAKLGILFVRLGRGEEMPKARTITAASPAGKQAKSETLVEMPLDRAVFLVTAECERSPLPSINVLGNLLQAVTQSGIVKTKHHLSAALISANAINNNHLKPLILSLLANLFANTKIDEAKKMASSAYLMARAMGSTKHKSHPDKALPPPDASIVGSPRIGLFLGEMLLSIYKAEGDTEKLAKQSNYNAAHARVVSSIGRIGMN